jgi:hypothetical protein
MGNNPPALNDLTQTVLNAQGQTAGPFMAAIPAPPAGWSSYAYNTSADGTFTISATGDNTTARVP